MEPKMSHEVKEKPQESKFNEALKYFIKDFGMGGVAGIIAKTANAPIERVKILLQVQKTIPSEQLVNPYKGILNCFYRIPVEEGFLAYWKGNLANCLRYFPTTAINFAVKDSIRSALIKDVNPRTEKLNYFLRNLLSGGIAGSIGLSIVYSLDFARTRLGADLKKKGDHQKEFNGLVDCYVKIFKKDGILGLYRGFGISVVGIFIYRSFYFGMYDTGKEWIWGDVDAQRKASFLIKFIFAQIIVISAETLSFPIDTVRRRLMMQSGRKSKADMKYKGTIDCFTKTLAEEGFTGFFKGNLGNVWRSLGSSLVLVLYDKFKQEWFGAPPTHKV